jgi:hypothetical protein
MLRRLVLTVLVVTLMGIMSLPTSAAQKKATFGVTATNPANCTVSTVASWSGARVHDVDVSLDVGGVPYGPMSTTIGKRKNSTASSGTIPNTFTVTNAGTATAHADFYSAKLALVGSADSAAITVSCT